MKALRFEAWQSAPRLGDVPWPKAGLEDVVIEVLAAGLCHSDLTVVDAPAGALPFDLPFTMGHETAGRVVSIGSEVSGLATGDAVVVYGPWGCGHCPRCQAGSHNYCDDRAALTAAGVGLGVDGGMAEALRIPAWRAVPIGDLDPVMAAPLTDAGLTPYHAIARSRHHLTDDAVALVIGVGGLGHLAIQILRATTRATVVAVDTREAALELADRCGAHAVVRAGDDADREVREVSGGRGADVVFDFVGSDVSLELAAASLRVAGELNLVGSGRGVLRTSKPGPLPMGASVVVPFWGTRTELVEVVDLARAGKLRVETESFALSDAATAFARLREATLAGRAVLVPDPGP